MASAGIDGGACVLLTHLARAARAHLLVPSVGCDEAGARTRGDALTQALVLKNYGASEVLLEYDRGARYDVASMLDDERFGFTPIFAGSRGNDGIRAPARDPDLALDPRSSRRRVAHPPVSLSTSVSATPR